MSTVKAFDMGRFWRLVSVDGGRVTGTFWVSLPAEASRNRNLHVVTVDVVVWADEQHTWGRTLGSRDLTAFVETDGVRIPEHMIRKEIRPDVLDVLEEMKTAIALAVTAAQQASATAGGESGV